MYIVSPLSNCASLEKREKFLDYIKQIAPVTQATEPDCIGYTWFRGAGDNDAVPPHWVRGFEIYRRPEASTIDHRASDEYKAFRKAVGEEKLLERPSDLRFWRPAGIGFLTRGPQVIFADKKSDMDAEYVVTEELAVKAKDRHEVMAYLKGVADKAQANETVLSFWVLNREGTVAGCTSDSVDDFYIFSRFLDANAYREFTAGTASSAWATLANSSGSYRITTWVESGIGFLGR